MTTGRQYHQTKLQSGDGKCGHSGRQLWDHCRVLRNNVVIYMPHQGQYVDAKVKVHLLKNIEQCDTLGRLVGGPRGRGAPWCGATLKGMVTFTQSYTKFEKVKPAADRGHPCPLPIPTQASQNPERALFFFFGYAGSSLWGTGSSLLQGGFL